MSMRSRLVAVALGALALWACAGPAKGGDRQARSPGSDRAETAAEDPAARLFDPSHVLSVDIAMAQEDWDALRREGRDASAMYEECKGGPKKVYEYRRASVTIDGTKLEGVGVRKKGFLGSTSVLRPSFKLKLDAFVEGQRYLGVRRMTLNNNKQDQALMRTCLAYELFRDAGLPAPRCNFARVSVNGKPFGIYSHVEEIKKPFLRRQFGDDSGELFEGQLADFAPEWNTNFERKNKTKGEGDVLAAVEAALALPDSEVRTALASLVDYDSFLTFWALEALGGLWDGYTNDRNNFYLYRNPGDGKLHFIPWGPDMSFTETDMFHAEERPTSVSAEAALARRLYALPEVRAEYVERMRELLVKVWDEKALLAEVARIDTLLGGAPGDEDVAEIERFIKDRKAKMAPELSAGGSAWKVRAKTTPCFLRGSEIRGEFATTFGDLEPPNPMIVGKAHLELALNGKAIELAKVGVVSGFDEKANSTPAVRYVGIAGSSIYVIQLFFEKPLFASGATEPFHGYATWGLVIELEDMHKLRLRGMLGKGSITLDKASTEPGAPVEGSFAATVYELPPSESGE